MTARSKLGAVILRALSVSVQPPQGHHARHFVARSADSSLTNSFRSNLAKANGSIVTKSLGSRLTKSSCRSLTATESFQPSGFRGVVIGRSLQAAGTESSLSSPSVRAAIDEINDLFAEAREEIETARESLETVYFNEEQKVASEAVESVLEKFKTLLSKLSEADAQSLQRSMGLKMEQLKAELQLLNEAAADH